MPRGRRRFSSRFTIIISLFFTVVVADDWLACLPQPAAERLMAAFYERAPIHTAIAALSRHLHRPGPARILLAQLVCTADAQGARRLLEAHASRGTAPSLTPSRTVHSFSTHGHRSAAKGSSTTVSRSDIRLILTF